MEMDFGFSEFMMVWDARYIDYIAYFRDEAAFGAITDGDGEVTDYVRLTGITKRRNAWREEDREKKVQDNKK